MGYGDLQYFDILIFAAIAVFLVFRLTKVLGKRTGFEKDQKDSKGSKGSKGSLVHENNLINNKNKEKIIPELNSNISELKKAYEVLENFDHNNFIDGAKIAFETIINAFNKGNIIALKSLLTEETYTAFEKAINDKINNPENQMFSLYVEKIENVSIDGGKIIIRIKFISEQLKNNDESTIIKKEDTWSFEKLIASKNPNWLLSST